MHQMLLKSRERSNILALLYNLSTKYLYELDWQDTLSPSTIVQCSCDILLHNQCFFSRTCSDQRAWCVTYQKSEGRRRVGTYSLSTPSFSDGSDIPKTSRTTFGSKKETTLIYLALEMLSENSSEQIEMFAFSQRSWRILSEVAPWEKRFPGSLQIQATVDWHVALRYFCVPDDRLSFIPILFQSTKQKL